MIKVVIHHPTEYVEEVSTTVQEFFDINDAIQWLINMDYITINLDDASKIVIDIKGRQRLEIKA